VLLTSILASNGIESEDFALGKDLLKNLKNEFQI